MKIVVNKEFGGFGCGLSSEDRQFVYRYENDRTNDELIAFVESHPIGECGDLQVVEIPDSATDWEVDEYDGFESIIYVVDGKIHRA